MNTFSAAFGARLREERDRKGLSQADFGALGGVGKLAQLNYEKGERLPSVEYLHGIGRHGVDTDYLLYGVRAPVFEDPRYLALQGALLARYEGESLPVPVDAGLLAEAILSIDNATAEMGVQVSPTRRARGIANLYLAFSRSSPEDRAWMRNAAALLVSEWIPSNEAR
jgi:transcriptional regulator with XRE-family HTH domain